MIAAVLWLVVVSPGHAGGGGEFQIEAKHDVGSELGASRRLQVAREEFPRPHLTRVAEDRGVDRVKEEGIRLDAALRASEWPAVVRVDDGDVRAAERIRSESAVQTER